MKGIDIMNKVKVICHMYTTIDGKIVTDIAGYPDCEVAGNIYDELTFTYGKAWGCGRSTFTYLSDEKVNLNNYKAKEGLLVDHIIKDERYCFSFDRKGKLFFKDVYNDYAGHKSRLVYVLTKQVDRRFITYLDDMNLSYMFCGDNDLDIDVFLSKLGDLGIDTFVLCGGAEINAAFLNGDYVDEISLVICNGIQGGRKEITFVGTNDVSKFPKYFKVKEVKVLADNTVYLHYVK